MVDLHELALPRVAAGVEDDGQDQQRQPHLTDVAQRLVDPAGVGPADLVNQQAHVSAGRHLPVYPRPVPAQVPLDAPVSLADQVGQVLVVGDEGHVPLHRAVARLVCPALEDQVPLEAPPVVVQPLDKLRQACLVGQQPRHVRRLDLEVLRRHIHQQPQQPRELHRRRRRPVLRPLHVHAAKQRQ